MKESNLFRSESYSNRSRIGIAAALLLVLVFSVYSNTFDADWQFDDKPNILKNKLLHVRNLKPESLVQTFFTKPTTPGEFGENLYRPITFLTFAINWYFGKDKVLGYHVVNVLIHFLTTIFLFAAILNVLRAPNLTEKFDRNRYLIAFLSAALWAINPIQTQAVTYIVQRMASMAAMFYILSMLCYIKCRLSSSSSQRIFFLLSCALTFLLALGSKENAAMLPASLLLIELVCFQHLKQLYRQKIFFWSLVGGAVIIFILGVWFFISDVSISFLNGYQNRAYTLSERLLTEPRIILFYMSQIFFPLPGRLSVEHDVTLSTSFFQPWTTLPAIMLTLMLIGLGLSQMRKRPIIALAILFYYLNHIVESTVLPLELIFEHRNYLPSMFLFLPVAAGFKWLYDVCSARRHPLLTGGLTGLAVLSIVFLSIGTYVRNLAWATEMSLWRDAMVKAPQSARPLTNLAWQMAYGPTARESLYDEALMLYKKALALHKPRLDSDPIIMNNIAGIYFKQEKYHEAIEILNRALQISPGYDQGRYDLARILIVGGSWDAAAEHIEYLLSKDNAHHRYLSLKGLIYLNQKKYDAAIDYFRRSMSYNLFFKETLMNLGIAYSLIGDFGSAEVYLMRAHQVHPKNMIPLLGLIENRLRADDIDGARKYADILFNTYSRAAITEQLQDLSKSILSLFISRELISPLIKNVYANITKDTSDISN